MSKWQSVLDPTMTSLLRGWGDESLTFSARGVFTILSQQGSLDLADWSSSPHLAEMTEALAVLEQRGYATRVQP